MLRRSFYRREFDLLFCAIVSMQITQCSYTHSGPLGAYFRPNTPFLNLLWMFSKVPQELFVFNFSVPKQKCSCKESYQQNPID